MMGQKIKLLKDSVQRKLRWVKNSTNHQVLAWSCGELTNVHTEVNVLLCQRWVSDSTKYLQTLIQSFFNLTEKNTDSQYVSVPPFCVKKNTSQRATRQTKSRTQCPQRVFSAFASPMLLKPTLSCFQLEKKLRSSVARSRNCFRPVHKKSSAIF